MAACPDCGQPNGCDLAKGHGSCWCFYKERLKTPVDGGTDCLCEQCLDTRITQGQAHTS